MNGWSRWARVVLSFGAIAVALSTWIVAGAAHADEYYKGKTIRILIGFPPGGSYDLYAQLMTQQYGRKIAGNPNVVVEHRPGGGGRTATAYFFTKAPTDGTVIGMLPETLTQLQLMEPDKVRWDMRQVNYIGSLVPAHSVFGVRGDSGIKTVQDALTKDYKVGCTARTSGSAQVPLLIKNLVGAKFEMVCGYRGSGPYRLALERNEIQGFQMNWATWTASLAEKVKAGEVIPLWQTGVTRGGDSKHIPVIQEVMGDERTKKVFEFVGSPARVGRGLLGPPRFPAERLKEQRAAFNAMIADPEFKAEIAKRGLLFDPAPGEVVDETIAKVLATPKEIVELAIKGMSEGFKEGCVNCGK